MLRLVLLSMVGAAFLPKLTSAHHSYSAYDMAVEEILHAQIEQVDWVNPHIIIWLQSAHRDGGGQTVRIEGHAPLMLNRNGFDYRLIKRGDQVRVAYHPLRQGRGGSLVSITLVDGRRFNRFGVLQRTNSHVSSAGPPAEAS